MINLSGILNTGDDYSQPEPQPDPQEEEPEEVPEDPFERAKVLNIIKLTWRHFSADLSSYKSKVARADKLSLDDLKCLAQEMETTLTMDSQFEKMNEFFYTSVKILEEASYITPYHLKGFAKKVEASESIKRDVALVCLRQCSRYNVSPEKRLLISMSALAFDTAMRNKAETSIKKEELARSFQASSQRSEEQNVLTLDHAQKKVDPIKVQVSSPIDILNNLNKDL